jgi:hypothetical protein
MASGLYTPSYRLPGWHIFHVFPKTEFQLLFPDNTKLQSGHRYFHLHVDMGKTLDGISGLI